MNRYKNPWWKSCNTPRPEYYVNDAPVVHSYRGVEVFKLIDGTFQYVTAGWCITHRGSGKGKFNADAANVAIDRILDGHAPCTQNLAEYLRSLGHAAKSYEEFLP